MVMSISSCVRKVAVRHPCGSHTGPVRVRWDMKNIHYGDVTMGVIASQITSLTIVYSTVYSDADKKKPSKLRVTGLCVWKSPRTGEFPAQMASNAENDSIWWSHHVEIPAWGPCGVLRIFRSNHKCTAVSNRTGPVAWCDHENNTGVKFLRALHLASRARNGTGAKNPG